LVCSKFKSYSLFHDLYYVSSAILQGQYLVVGNVGDSRAVMGTRDSENTLVAVQLTVDLKPNLPGWIILCECMMLSCGCMMDPLIGFFFIPSIELAAEAERIRKCRGRVFALRDEPEVCRVWLPNCDSPGLAMARAFGDFCLKDFGLISVPDVSFRQLTEKDEFIVLATDGVNTLSLRHISFLFAIFAAHISFYCDRFGMFSQMKM